MAEIKESRIYAIDEECVPSPWQGEGGLLGARMAGVKESRFMRLTRDWFPLLDKERVRVRFQPMPKSIELKCPDYC
jgi:hypothetical protein